MTITTSVFYVLLIVLISDRVSILVAVIILVFFRLEDRFVEMEGI